MAARRKTGAKAKRRAKSSASWAVLCAVALVLAAAQLLRDALPDVPHGTAAASPAELCAEESPAGGEPAAPCRPVEPSDAGTVRCEVRSELPAAASGNPVIEHMGYTVSYDCEALNPEWVAYELTAYETEGDLGRASRFTRDPDLMGAQAEDSDFRHSGWDRGHMAPAADMKWSSQAMKESFYLTNICPQNHNLNAGDWKSLEESCRSWARRFGRVWIACGPIFDCGEYGTIGDNGVVVPDGFYKVVLARVGDRCEAAGFLFRNRAGHKSLRSCVVTVDSVETVTGQDFFCNLPDTVQCTAESRVDTVFWGL
ncbi:MAG: DNA/RNA non-specific endonuclease [Alistipes sp.]|nr:DNA/RNA non-specific endonuclease [Alistipes sp.]